MFLSKNWLQDFVELNDLSAEALEDVITTKIAEVDGFEVHGKDVVFEIDNKSLTHRPDLWSHYGFARELAGVLRRELKICWDEFADDSAEGRQRLKELTGSGNSKFTISIAPGSGCRRFMALEIKNVRATESPAWMKERLSALGVGCKNLLVDLSNYVMFDVGQPNHAYDADKLQGTTISVRRATAGENFEALDDTKHKLGGDEIVIADDSGAIALGGVIGGKSSAISDSTSRLLLESANFDPALVRVTAKRYALRTDASNRFEKSRSPYSAPLAIHRFVQLLKELQPNCEIAGSVADAFIEKPKPVTIALDLNYVRSRLTESLDDKAITDILTALHFGVSAAKGSSVSVQVPHERATRDISIADDLVEEVGRVYGYENIAEIPPLVKATATRPNAVKEAEYGARDFLVGSGFSEISTYSFSNRNLLSQLGFAYRDLVELENPIDVDLPVLRPSLIPGMIKAVDENARFGQQFALFEIGRSYHGNIPKNSTKPAGKRAGFERRLLAIGYITGRLETALGAATNPQVSMGADFFAVADALKRLCRLYGDRELALRPLSTVSSGAGDYSGLQAWMHPVRAAGIFVTGSTVPFGYIAEICPGVLENTKSRAVVAEMDTELLLREFGSDDHYLPISKFPVSLFEMSVVMPRQTPFAELEALLRQSSPAEALQKLELLAVYEGKPLKTGEKSVSVKLHLGANDRTLSNEELKSLQDSLIAAIQKSDFSLRA